MTPKPETRLSNKIKAHVKGGGGVVLKLHGSTMQESGQPDLMGWIAVGDDPVHFAVELKMPGRDADELQEWRLKEWGRGDFCVGVVHSLEEFLQLVYDYQADRQE